MTPSPGFDAAMRYSLFDALFNRRSCRIMQGVKEVVTGSFSGHHSDIFHPEIYSLLSAFYGLT